MKNSIYLISIALLFTISCAGEGKSNESTAVAFCPEMTFDSPKTQADAIIDAFQKASDSTNVNRLEAEQTFYCIFPSNYEDLLQLFGYQGETPPIIDAELGWEITEFFTNLTSIPKEEYYSKYIDLTVNGVNDAEDPAYAFSVGSLIEKDPKNAAEALSKKSQQEIESVFVYIYDEVEIGNLDMTFEHRQKLLAAENAELAAMHKSVFDALSEKWAKEFEIE